MIRSAVVCLGSALLVACSPVADPILGAVGAMGGMGGPDGAIGESGADGEVMPAKDATTEPPPIPQYCGDGIKNGDGEVCDDFANPTKGFGCNDGCTAVNKAMCGDMQVTAPEVCDPPSAYCDSCTKIIGSCGDGITQSALEECDTKGESPTCNSNCKKVVCGDGIVNTAAKEVCDDHLNDGRLGSCTSDCSDYVAKAADAQYASCKDMLTAARAAAQDIRSGFYWLKAKDNTPYIAYCDMVSDNGGWTLIMRAIQTNFDYTDALWSNSTLENPTSVDFVSVGTRSKYKAYLEVAFTEIRTSEVDNLSVGYVAAVTQPNALTLFGGSNSGDGVGITIASGADALEPYFNSRADPDDRQWGCNDYTYVGFNLRALLKVKDDDSKSIGASLPTHCDWDGGARFGQRVNGCHYTSTGGECSGNHLGQGWGNFRNWNPSPYKARPIRQLLWVR
jgi:hypothetical protein